MDSRWYGVVFSVASHVPPTTDTTMPLTDTQIRNARFNPDGTGNRLTDGGRMYLQLTASGGKLWRINYRFNEKDKTLALGVYPDVSLAVARKKRDEAREKLAAGIDPGESKKAEKRTQRLNAENSFEAIAREWHAKYAPTWSEGHGERILRRLEVDAFTWIGGKPMADLAPPDVLDVLRRVEKRGALETAHRLHANIGQACRYAVATGRAQRDITADLRGALPPVQVEHMAAITDPKQVAELLRAIDGYTGTFPVACALKLAPLLFQRPGELRAAEWAEFDLEGCTWEIPGDRMKRTKQGKAAGGAHIVPLSSQAVAILHELRLLTGSGRLLFPSVRTKDRPMSDNTVNGALRRLGYDGHTMTGHGFRAMARTILDEVLRVPAEIVEAQLAHAVKGPLGRAYNRTTHLPQRREMMQKWADYLDQLKAGATVVPLSPSVTSAPKAARYFVDTEFTSLDNAELISVGIVSQDGREFYAERSHFAREACSDFVHTHVLPQLGKMPTRVLTDAQLRNELRKWIAAIPLDPPPVLCCDAGGATYDLPLLYFALGGPLPRGWSTEDVSPLIDPVLLNSYHATHGGDHHALHDARANAYAFREPDAQVIPITAAVK